MYSLATLGQFLGFGSNLEYLLERLPIKPAAHSFHQYTIPILLRKNWRENSPDWGEFKYLESAIRICTRCLQFFKVSNNSKKVSINGQPPTPLHSLPFQRPWLQRSAKVESILALSFLILFPFVISFMFFSENQIFREINIKICPVLSGHVTENQKQHQKV